MKLLKSVKLTITIFFENIKQISIDRQNRKKFIEEINLQIANPNSKFNLFKMSIDQDYTKLCCYINVPENYLLAGTDILIFNKLKDEARPINDYIGRDLVWGEYFKSPEFFYIDDVEDSENVSCTYLAIWNYAPVLEKFPKFKYQLSAFIIINLLLLAGIVFGITLLF